jgi:hypothetical protein
MGIHCVFFVVKDNAIVINILHRDCEMRLRRIVTARRMRYSGFINSVQDLLIRAHGRYVPCQRN